VDEYPIQGKLRIRADQYERDRAYIEPRVGKLSAGEVKGMPGFEFLKFWYGDFAATAAQWAEIQPELDRRNILVTMYEAPVLYMEALAEQAEEKAESSARTDPIKRLSTIAAVLIALAGLALVVFARLDAGACVAVGVLALLVGIAGQLYASRQAPKATKQT
jgi:hypothetical protein